LNLQDLGNLGEFVGAIAVVATLVYLALNIRQNTAHLSQNTRAVQLSALQATGESTNRVREMLILNPELSDLYLKGLRGYSELELSDRLRFGMLLENFLKTAEAAYVRNVVLDVDPDFLEGIRKSLDFLLAHAGARDWWNRNRAGFRPVFRDLVEERLAGLGKGDAA
jgi:hypothetical protein